MKLEEMIMVIKSNRYGETNYLVNLEDYMETLEGLYPSSRQDRADAIANLYETRQGRIDWVEERSFSGDTYHSRFCNNVSELQKFLQGRFNNENTEKEEFYFEKELCSNGCMEVLLAHGLDEQGKRMDNAFHYERVIHTFQEGERVRNLNGEDYRILEVLNKQDLLLMSESTGDISVAEGTKYYVRTPNAEYDSVDSELYGVQWQHGIYFGNHITSIDFEKIKEEYAQKAQKNAVHKKAPVIKGPKL